MCVILEEWAFNNPSKFLPSEKLVLVRLCNRADSKSWICWPGHKSIARDCSISIRSSKNAVKTLVEKNYIKVTRRKTSSNKNQSNIYQVNGFKLKAEQRLIKAFR